MSKGILGGSHNLIDLSGHQESFELDDKIERKKHSMYDLKINEEYIVPRTTHAEGIYLIIRRVPSGWIYEYLAKNTCKIESTLFVPYTNEYKYADEL